MKIPCNRDLIASQMDTLGLTERAIVARTSIPLFQFRQMRIDGVLHQHVALGQLARVADMLATTIGDLLNVTPTGPPSESARPDVGAKTDSEVLIPLLVSLPRMVDIGFTSRCLSWSPQRMKNAMDAIPSALALTGLRLVSHHNAIRVLPTRPPDPRLRRTLGQLQSHRMGLSSRQARLLKDIIGGRWIQTQNLTQNDRLRIGQLKNAGCIELDEAARYRVTDQLRTAMPDL